MANRTRSERRYHYHRLKKYHKKRLKQWWGIDLPDTVIASYATTGTKCSCWMCGNPRRHHNQITNQEKINIINYIESCTENNIYCPFKIRSIKLSNYF